ncbi:hypothetical protein BT93_L0403 [Corymbia citriodora subsp. variegata]|uniref:Uncharacterized protein n=1 Tax=Corymbia citriodora subsp. variegata TaxID=360336 RepID=A0A8T0CGI8_CORYI|nr:hypothetical protein BT93_L0403 [Corymbia citriodora subsp. variegata]
MNSSFLYADRSLPLSSYGLTPSSLTLAFRLLLLTNIVIALRPLLPYLAKQDNLDDIPLTPSQRNLLGLPRSTAASPANAAQPGSYITPHRYRRSSPSPSVNGSGVSNRSNEAQYGASPQSTSRYAVGFSPTPTANSPSSTKRSIFSPSAGRDSPLLHRALTQSTSQNSLPTQPRSSDEVDFSESTRSLLSGRKASGNLADSTTSIPATPSPRSRERVKLDPGVNYKWLYDKGLRADGSPGASSFT